MEYGVPMMLLESGPWGKNINYVFSDEFTIAEKAATHLLDLGHRRIAYIYASCKANIRRLEGIKSAYASHGVPLEYLTIHENVKTLSAFREIMTKSNRPTAIISGCWSKVMEIADECGWSIPDDLSLLALNDSYELAFQKTPITAIRQPIEEIVFSAVHYLQGLKAGTISPPIRYEVLKSSLMIRSSVSYPVKFDCIVR